jgi:hypothetical protein
MEFSSVFGKPRFVAVSQWFLHGSDKTARNGPKHLPKVLFELRILRKPQNQRFFSQQRSRGLAMSSDLSVPPLSTGAIASIRGNNLAPHECPVVQILSEPTLFTRNGTTYYKLRISDGEQYTSATLASAYNHMVENWTLKEYSFICINDLTTAEVQGAQQVILIVVTPMPFVGTAPVGAPVDFEITPRPRRAPAKPPTVVPSTLNKNRDFAFSFSPSEKGQSDIESDESDGLFSDGEEFRPLNSTSSAALWTASSSPTLSSRWNSLSLIGLQTNG